MTYRDSGSLRVYSDMDMWGSIPAAIIVIEEVFNWYFMSKPFLVHAGRTNLYLL